ncbi:hypothetical protein [Curtobacterium sp. Leaf261]|uniref:hypothetical protein n=1 Tax=Curtobacterium sp. Leaf261 TaxID=1736311 RepID=UPI0012E1BAE8|nr:hypothetical protein [Curtobacterium sp. Leaf261]
MTKPIDALPNDATSRTPRMMDLASAVSERVGGEPSAASRPVILPASGASAADRTPAERVIHTHVATLGDDILLDELRRSTRVSTRQIRLDFTEVHTPAKVLGYVRRQRKQFIALRGDDPAWAEEIGQYPSESLAVEALRMRRA